MTQTIDTGMCPSCGQTKTLTARGLVRKHGACPGGGSAPAPGHVPNQLPHDRGTEETWTESTTSSLDRTLNQGPGSPPPTTGGVPSAGTISVPVTKSEQTDSVSGRDGSAAVTTTDAVDDFFAQPAAPVERRPEPKRDRWGRYVLAHPQTGKTGPWTRATTFAKSTSDTFALSQWGARMVLKGAAMRPDLTAMAVTLDVKRDRDTLNGLVEQAKDAAGQKVSANLGTALHALTEARDSGQQVDIPAVHRADVDAYTAALHTAGIGIVPHLIERVTCIPQWADGQALGVAGTFDRIVRLPDGTYAIGDLKTGADLQYGWQEIAIQLAVYAHGVNTSGVWDYDAGRWESSVEYDRLHPAPGSVVPTVRTDFGIVMHLPVGKATCTLYRVDLVQGWEGAQMCADVRAWRSRRALAEPVSVAALTAPAKPAVVREPTWAERFAAASSRGELSKLYAGAVEAGIRGAELAGLVDTGQRRLREITEQAG